MNGQCSGRACEVAATCGRFNPRIHADPLCGFGGNPDGPATHWVQAVNGVMKNVEDATAPD